MRANSRWLPDSAITTYFGKPAFHNYGNGNTKPCVGGTVYGDYLRSHNVNPESGNNAPEYKQVYGKATMSATIPVKGPSGSPLRKEMTMRKSHIPRTTFEEYRLNENDIEEQKGRNPIMPDKYVVTEGNKLLIE